MRKLFMPLLIVFMIIMAACGNNNANNTAQQESSTTTEPEFVTYESENGPIKVPAKPERVVMLSSGYVGNVLALDVPVVGVDSWAVGSSLFADKLKDVAIISEDDVEGVLNLEPDLIIASSTTANLEKFKEIAPTITYTYNALDYLSQHVEIGKLVGKEAEAQDWVNDFKARAKQAGQDVKAKHGDDVTVTVIEHYAKQMAVFGNNWGRGTEVIYQEMGLGMTDKVAEMALADGYYALSVEVLPEYAGDFIVLSDDGSDNSFKDTDTYKNIPAVSKGHVIEANAADFFFNDPITLEFQLQLFIDGFLGK
ncbi:iron-hydroxamate ABC transporter substrate-binding protein [Paenibacillus endoradicis]|uniref:iron-hydroxamate ABC transporter substrate-binding protein n=1 Tax=Paenibacillus endoradicis TaxID=2972487 RepID=UPI002158F3E0|nr:iron-hydroxamate ABC transporter substrate-binding protein [Paenibacillus endoradicis]MCR8657354.1 iron-hydroxamate ABC transporter substrate-binding protein [Paenibacillus endoradicis]